MTEETEKDVLYFKTFGRFSLTWNGTVLTGGSRTGESQFAYLMQYLLHNREKGVGRDQLEEVLFGERDIADMHHSLQVVIYNTKKRLRQAGLPDVNYIELRKGKFYWTEKVPVAEDALEFEQMVLRAEREKNPRKQMELYLKACYQYKGEFLQEQIGVLWAMQEAGKYRNLFCTCVERAAAALRFYQEYGRMEELGLYATEIQPLSDWEVVTMEAYVAQGQYEKAQRLYDNTVEFYSQEQGLRPSKKLMELLKQLGSQMLHQHESLDDIQEDLSMGDGAENSGGGGYFCTYPVFRGIYQEIQRMMERGGQSAFLMLCTVVDGKKNPMKDGPMLEGLSKRLERAIRATVRSSDIVNRYGKGQYLILLVNTTRENCKIVQKRINQQFFVGRQRTGIQYYVNSVFSAPFEPLE